MPYYPGMETCALNQPLMRALHVAVLLDCTTAWVKTLERRGLLPGAVWIGRRLMFQPDAIKQFVEAGGTPALPKQDPVVIARRAARGNSQAGARTSSRKKPAEPRGVKDRNAAILPPLVGPVVPFRYDPIPFRGFGRTGASQVSAGMTSIARERPVAPGRNAGLGALRKQAEKQPRCLILMPGSNAVN